jgi:hypothetical protein
MMNFEERIGFDLYFFIHYSLFDILWFNYLENFKNG